MKKLAFILLLVSTSVNAGIIKQGESCPVEEEGTLKFISGEILSCVSQSWIKLDLFPAKEAVLYYSKTKLPWDGAEIWSKETSFDIWYKSRETGKCAKVKSGHWGRVGARILGEKLQTRIQWNYGGRLYDTRWRNGKVKLSAHEGALARFVNSRDVEFFGHMYSCEDSKLGKYVVPLEGVFLRGGE